MTTQDDEFLKEIEEFSEMIDSLIDGIKMEFVRMKNKIIRALDRISYTTVSETIREKANVQLKRIKAIPNIASHLQKRYASMKTVTQKYQ